jgi:hypothetical protein
MQRNFEPMRKQVEAWQRSELTDVTAKVVIYEAFVEGKLEAPKHLARTVHENTKSFGRGQSGVSRTRLHQHSRDWSRFLSLRRRQSSESSWRLASRSRSKLHLAVPGSKAHAMTWGSPSGGPFCSCAEHVRQLGGESPLSNLVEVKG